MGKEEGKPCLGGRKDCCLSRKEVMVVVDVALLSSYRQCSSLDDKNSNVTRNDVVLHTLAILLWHREEYCWPMFSCQSRSQQRRDTDGGRGLWVTWVLVEVIQIHPRAL